MKSVYVIGTCDTKADELLFLKSVIKRNGLRAVLVDVGTRDNVKLADIANEEVASHHSGGIDVVLGQSDRGIAIKEMSEALCNLMRLKDDVAGVIGIGGSGGTALIAPMMQSLPIGVPKLLVSTVASGNVSSYIGATDTSIMYSVVDLLGLNPVLKKILTNAGNSIAGMVIGSKDEDKIFTDKMTIGLTMFGVTTACVEAITKSFQDKYNCLVFHATGTGGQSMEKLASSGIIKAVIDITTTEVCDYLFGGVFPCLPDRFDVFAEIGLPYLGSVGALDMVNFGAKTTVPSEHVSRNLFVHNPQVTLMRTNSEENYKMGCWIAAKLNKMEGQVRFLIPLQGISAIDAPNQPFYDPVANAALFSAIENTLIITKKRKLIKIDSHINDPKFSAFAKEEFENILDI